MEKARFLIGIDPGRNTGFCLYNRQTKKIERLELMTFWELIDFIESIDKQTQLPYTEFVLEDPQLNKPVLFSRNSEVGHAPRVMLKIAQDVGRNKEQAAMLIEYFRKHNIRWLQVQPTTSKWKTDYFNRLTGWKGTSNEHTRDAAKLVFGR